MVDKNFRPVNQMKYYSTDKKELIDNALNSDEYVLQKKIDGASYCLAKDLDGVAHLYGDKISKKTGEVIDKIDNVDHIKKFIENEFPNGSMIVAEIYTHYDANGVYHEREESKYTNSIMLCLPPKANERQKQTEVARCYMFDILFWDNKAIFDEDFAHRDALLDSLYDKWNYNWLEKAGSVKENKMILLSEWLNSGCEGGVLKKLSAPYSIAEIGQTAKRPAHVSYKVKTIDTVDVVITGVELPEKEYKGKNPDTYEYRDEDGNPVNRLWALDMINAFRIGLYNENGELVEIGTVASGLDDTLRSAAYQDPDYFKGMVAEIECMSIDKAGHSLRHPRYKQYRLDKEATDCTISHVFG